jgi:GDP-4-dehydro-6-deoxy-D-mannose reductase
VRKVKPDRLYHLAGMAFVLDARDNPGDAFGINVNGTINVLQAVRAHSPRTRILYVGSSDVYGKVPARSIPINESTGMSPFNLYSISKAAAEMIALNYVHDFGLHVVCMRPFNHIGPRQSPLFVSSDFASQIVKIERSGRGGVIRVGNLKARRDFTDVRDTVRGYIAALEKGKPGDVYNICSGRAISIAAMLKGLIRISGCEIRVMVAAEKVRKLEIPVFIGDNSRMRRVAGWSPEIPLHRTLGDILDYWRSVTG